MKTFTFQKFIKHVATVAVLGTIAGPTMAMTLTEYGILQQALTQLGSNATSIATDHNQCNQASITKSPINKKSLNPICNICIGEDGVAGKYAVLNNNGNISLICINTTAALAVDQVVPFPAQQITDLQTMCDSRGGTFVDLLGLGVFVACSYAAN